MANGRAIRRPRLHEAIESALARSPIALLLGPRQCGKTTLARHYVAADSPNYFDLENPLHQQRLAEPITALGPLVGTVVIDEVHRHPELFQVLRVLADRTPMRARFLLLGSASMELLQQASESLAGRAAIVSMQGFGVDEVGARRCDQLWLRGGYPRSFLAADATSSAWRRDYVKMVLERDVQQFGVGIAATALHRFWSMVAHSHAGIWSSSDPARSMGIAESTIRRYLDLMTDLLLVRQLQPWHENLGKRQVKAPKVYVRDSGLLHHFLGVETMHDLLQHPRCGASWEGFVVEEVVRCVQPDAQYFWATHAGAELDLMLFVGGKRVGVEVKRVDAPRMTRSLAIAREDLRLDAAVVIHPGVERFPIADGVEAVPISALAGNGPHVLLPGLFAAPRTRPGRASRAGRARRPRRPS